VSWKSAFQVPETGAGWLRWIWEKSELVKVKLPLKSPAPFVVVVRLPFQTPCPMKLAWPHQKRKHKWIVPVTSWIVPVSPVPFLVPTQIPLAVMGTWPIDV